MSKFQKKQVKPENAYKFPKGHKINVGRKASKKTKELMSNVHKGNKYCLGHKLTDEHKRHIGESAKNYKKTKEHRKNLSEALTGKKASNETRKILSGIHKKMCKEGKNIPPSRKGLKPWNKDLHDIYSKETIDKIKKARAKQIFPINDTKIEVKIQNFLKKLGIEFFTHQYMNIEHCYQCDILVPSMNLVIECDGNYWHKYPVGLEKDHIRTKELIEKGFKVLRLWEFEINKMTITDFKKRCKISV